MRSILFGLISVFCLQSVQAQDNGQKKNTQTISIIESKKKEATSLDESFRVTFKDVNASMLFPGRMVDCEVIVGADNTSHLTTPMIEIQEGTRGFVLYNDNLNVGFNVWKGELSIDIGDILEGQKKMLIKEENVEFESIESLTFNNISWKALFFKKDDIYEGYVISYLNGCLINYNYRIDTNEYDNPRSMLHHLYTFKLNEK